MLFSFYLQPLYRLEKTETPDSEGGTKTTYEVSELFEGALAYLNSNLWPMGDSDRLNDQYKLYVSRAVSFDLHDVFRDSKGQTYRIISTPKQAPEGFTDLDLRSYKAERWNIS